MKKLKSKAISLVTALLLVFTLLPLLPDGTIKASATTVYKLKIAGTSITSDNCNNYLGVFTYDASTKTLTVSGNYLGDNTAELINCQIDGLTINVTMESTLDGYMLLPANTTITGKKLTIRTGSNSFGGLATVVCNGKLTFKDAEVVCIGSQPFYSDSARYCFENSTVIADARDFNDNYTVAFEFKNSTDRFDLVDCAVVSPSGCVIGKNKIFESDGTTAAKYVKVVPDRLKLAGKVVDITENCDDILGGGEASYNASTKTLSLRKSINCGDKKSYSMIDGLKVNIINDVTISTDVSILFLNTTITGLGKMLTATSAKTNPIYCEGRFILDNTSVELSGTAAAWFDFITVKNSTLKVTNSSGTGALQVDNADSITLVDSKYSKPAGAQVKGFDPNEGNYDYYVADSSGNKANTVEIVPAEKYDLYVAGKQVNELNKGDILGGGEASYDPSTKTLTLKKSIILESKNCIENKGISGLTVKATNNVMLETLWAPIVAREDTVITGNGILKLKSVNGELIYSEKSLKIKNTNIEGSGIYGFILGSHELINSTISLTTTANAIGDASSLKLTDCKIVTPSGGKIAKLSDGKYYVVEKDGKTKAKTVKIVPCCDHKLTETAAKVATCTENGNKAYWYCSRCKKYFSDKDGDTETTVAEMTVPAKGHSWGTPSWSWNGTKSATARFVCKNSNKHIQNVNATIKSTTTKATCTKAGKTVYTATAKFNGKTYTDSKTVTLKATGHSWSKWTTAKKATCTKGGTETRKCSKCNTTETRPTKALGHSFSDWKTTSFDVDKKTATQTRKCSRGDKTDTQTVKNAIVRYAGSNRAETGTLISAGMYKTADTVIIATGFDFHDALAAVPLASAYNAPLLLADRDNLSDKTIAEIKRLKAKNVIVVATTTAKDNNGYDAAIKSKVYTQLKTLGVKVTKLDGKTFYETAKKVADALGKKKAAPTSVFITTDKNFADALSASPVAAILGAPILYVDPKAALNATTKNYLASVKKSVQNVYIVGGEYAVPKNVEKAILNTLGKKSATRFAGDNRYDTCVLINKSFAKDLTGKSVCIAKGYNFPDALAGGVFAAKNKAPLFLADAIGGKTELSKTQSDYLKSNNPSNIYIIGGETAIPTALVKTIAKASV